MSSFEAEVLDIGIVSARADPLWEKVVSGDEEAFREIFQLHHNAVYNFCFRHVASWEEAEEATQASFTTLWRRAKSRSLPSGMSARAWLLVTARNECRNLVRARNRRLQLFRKIESQPENQSDNVARWLEDEATMRSINEVLSRIPDNQRQVVELVVWADLGMAETAKALDIAVGTVKSRLSRARSALAHSDIAHLLEKEN